jgi:hypothetical protein
LFFGQAELHARVLKRISLHALRSLKQTLRRALP